MLNIKYSVADDDGVFRIFTNKIAFERIIPDFNDDIIAHPLPKLILRRPKIVPVVTANQRVFLLLLLFLFSLHKNTGRPKCRIN